MWGVGLSTLVYAGTAPVFVLNSLEASISVIDPVTWTETKRILTGKEPHHLYLTPDEKSLIIANALGDTLLFVDLPLGGEERGGNSFSNFGGRDQVEQGVEYGQSFWAPQWLGLRRMLER